MTDFIVRLPDGELFRCICGCNVFHKPDIENEPHVYSCNGCGTKFQGNNAGALAMSDYRPRIRYAALKLRCKCDPDFAADEITTLRQQLAESQARAAGLEATLYHGNLEREKLQKARDLRLQAEAVEAATETCEIKSVTDDSKCYSPALRDYAQRLRQQADEAERAGGEK